MNPRTQSGSTSNLRRVHRGLVLQEFLREPQLSRTKIASRLGLSQMAISRIIRDLLEAGLIEETGAVSPSAGPGRRRQLLQIKADGVYAGGIALSAFGAEAVVTDASGKQVGRRDVDIQGVTEGEDALALLAEALNVLIRDLEIDRDRIAGVCIAIGALLDETQRAVVDAGYLGWKPFDLIEPLARMTGLSAFGENITRALAVAECNLGVARECSDIVVVRVATSIGSAAVRGGELVRGFDNHAGQIGHLHQRPTDLTCSCGRHDCLNNSASGWAALISAGLISEPAYQTELTSAYAAAIDTLAGPVDADNAELPDANVQALQDAGEQLAGALRSVDLFFGPEAILISGRMSRVEPYMEGVRRGLAALEDAGEVVQSKLRAGELHASQAAAILVLLNRVYSPNLDIDGLMAAGDASLESAHRRSGAGA